MALRMTNGASIENPRGYAAETVEDLFNLLSSGGQGQQDPHREHFYEIEGTKDIFFIHISPITGNVVLLAKWSRHAQEPCLDAEHLVAN
jgi:hypothetical protein